MDIRPSTEKENAQIFDLQRAAFGIEKGQVIAELVKDLFTDQTALPLLSLVAMEKDVVVGHVLFTAVKITHPDDPVSARILAPLAVHPDCQKQGVGRRLIENGLAHLKASGVALVFVLGHPDYYPRCGFAPAGIRGFEAPYEIPPEHAAAWMVQELRMGVIGKVKGTVKCSAALNQPEHWRE